MCTLTFLHDYFRAGFLKMDHMAPVGVISEIKGQLAAKGYKGAVSSKGATGWPLGHNLKLTLHVLDYY